MQKSFRVLCILILITDFVVYAGIGVGESKSGILMSLPPDVPVLSTPHNGMPAVPDSVAVTWNSLIHSSSFNLQVATVHDFSAMIIDETGIFDTSFVLTGLERNTTHYWRVNAVNVAGSGDFSAVWSFTTMKPAAAAPELYQPADGTRGVDPNLELRWNSVAGAISYHLQVSDRSDFSNLTVDKTNLANTWYQVELVTDKIWHWRVSATNEGGEGTFSGSWTFSTWGTGIEDGEIVPKIFALLPVYPNPFNATASITYHVPKTAEVSLVVYNNVGQAIRNLATGSRQAGRYTVHWDSHDNYRMPVTSGMYLCRFESGDHIFIQKMLLLR